MDKVYNTIGRLSFLFIAFLVAYSFFGGSVASLVSRYMDDGRRAKTQAFQKRIQEPMVTVSHPVEPTTQKETKPQDIQVSAHIMALPHATTKDFKRVERSLVAAESFCMKYLDKEQDGQSVRLSRATLLELIKTSSKALRHAEFELNNFHYMPIEYNIISVYTDYLFNVIEFCHTRLEEMDK